LRRASAAASSSIGQLLERGELPARERGRDVAHARVAGEVQGLEARRAQRGRRAEPAAARGEAPERRERGGGRLEARGRAALEGVGREHRRVHASRRGEARDVEAPSVGDRERREARPVVVLEVADKGVERGAARGRAGGAGGREAELLDRGAVRRPVGRGGGAATAKVEAERRCVGHRGRRGAVNAVDET
jgi:hypothetical protein